MIEWLKQHMPPYISMPLVLVVLVFSAVCLLPDSFLQTFLERMQLQEIIILRVLLLLLLWLASVALCYAFLYKKYSSKPNIDDYEFFNAVGLYKHKKKKY